MNGADDERLLNALGELGAADQAGPLADSKLLGELEARLFGRPRARLRLERYILLEQLGAGSFGVVYAGYDPELDRKVAIKLLRPGSGSTLLKEAQSLARFAHPNVVAIHDVGRFDAGELGISLRGDGDGGTATSNDDGVFIVMEHLSGPSLGEWTSGQRSWREIVHLWCRTGAGLAAAHEIGLIHRDFKPQNVMLGADGRPRVLDFGLASVNEGPGADGVLAGSPAYMAPEQHARNPPDPRADQFAFCVTLYEALYGQRPFVAKTVEMLGKAKLTGDYPRAARLDGAPAHIGRVIDRGLSADPANRFGSMRSLLTALARATVTRQRRLLAGALGVSVAALLTGTLLWNQSTRRAACEADDEALEGIWDLQTKMAIQQRFAAESGSAGEVTYVRVAEALDSYTAEWTELRTQACARSMLRREEPPELMARRMLCLDRRLQRVAGITGSYASADARAVRRAMDGVISLPEPSSCLDRDMERGEVGTIDRELSLSVEAEVARTEAEIAAGRFGPALEQAVVAVARADEGSASDSTRAIARLSLARAQRLSGELDAAQHSNDEALVLAERDGHELLATQILVHSVRVLDGRGKHEAAQRVADQARARISRVAPDGALEAELDYNLGVLHLHRGAYPEGRAVLEEGLERRTRVYGTRHPLVAAMHNTVGNLLEREGRSRDALDQMQRALDIWMETLGPEHPDVARVLNNLGNVTKDLGDNPEALRLYQKSLLVYELNFAPDHPSLAIIHHNLGIMKDLLGEREQALGHFRHALEIRRAKLTPHHPLTISTLAGLGSTLIDMGNLAEAKPVLEEALSAPESSSSRAQAERAYARYLEATSHE